MRWKLGWGWRWSFRREWIYDCEHTRRVVYVGPLRFVRAMPMPDRIDTLRVVGGTYRITERQFINTLFVECGTVEIIKGTPNGNV